VFQVRVLNVTVLSQRHKDFTFTKATIIIGGDLLQVKGSAYSLEELLGDRALAEFYHDGCYVTLRLTAGMYHRFHAPYDCRIEHVTHIWGDTWNLSPAVLARIEKLFCRNERVVIRACLAAKDQLVTLVPSPLSPSPGFACALLIWCSTCANPLICRTTRRFAKVKRWAGSNIEIGRAHV